MKRFLSILLTAATVLSLSACGSSSSSTASSDTAASETADTTDTTKDSNDTVVIGTMDLVNADLIAQYEEYYENELGLPVKLVTFDSGKDVNTALAAGSVDISELGSSPSALGLSSG
ncbi:MAG: hypothetical protein LIO44_04410, partial [Eubacterium sp.]|nr:hypothetical protein [Eubacterium sp.]